MRKNKKLLLASVAALGALAIGVGATSTFAWFQATGSGAKVKSNTTDTQTMSVTDPGYTATAVNLPIKVYVDKTSADGNLELTHYYAKNALIGQKDPDGKTYVDADTASPTASQIKSTAGFYHAFYTGAGAGTIRYTATDNGSLKQYAAYTISISLDFPALDAPGLAQEAPALGTPGYWKNGVSGDTVYYNDENGFTWDASTAATKLALRTPQFEVDIVSGSRAMFYDLSKDTPVTAKATAAGNSNPDAVTCNVLTGFDGSKTAIGYFGLYVDGQKDSVEFNDVHTAVSGNFTVTVSDSAA